jgi:hypothetical protein
MTTPAGAETAAGAPETGDASPEQTPTGQQSATDQAADWATTFEGMTPEEVSAKLEHARTWEKRAKENKAKLDQAKAATVKPKDGEPTLEDLQAQTASERERAEKAEERAAELAYDIAISRAASKVGADAEALSDSDRFRREVTEELGDDFDDDDLKAAVQKIAAKFAKDPRFAGSKAPARSGADITGGPGTPRQITEDELHKMTPEQIVEAQDKGLLRNLLGG